MSESPRLAILEQPVKPRRRRRGVGFVLLLAAIGILVLALGIATFYIGRSLTALNDITRDSSHNLSEYPGRPTAPASAPGAQQSPVNFALLGTDERAADETGRSDALMLAHLSGDRKHLYIISFPRDMWVPIPERGDGKINWAYAFGGPPLTARTLEQLTGSRIDHAVSINFEGFIRLTETLGGVTVNNPWESEGTPGHHFPQGNITLEGEDALIYVRERTVLPNGDLDRAYRQRSMVKAILQQALRPNVLANPVAFSDFVGRFSDTLTVDEALTTEAITSLGMSLRFEGADSVRLLQAPVAGWGTVGDQAVAVVDTEGMTELSVALAGDAMESYYQAHS